MITQITFRWWLILVCLNGTVPATIIWKYRSGEISSANALLSTVIVLAAGNAVALLGIRRHKKRYGGPLRRDLVIGAAALAFLAFLSATLGIRLVHPRNEYEHIAMSNTPLASIEPEQKRLVVELIRRTAAISQEEKRAMALAQKVSMNPVVYAPESFANRQTIQSTLDRLTDYAEIDFRYFDEQESAREDFRRKMAACDAGYLKKWDDERKEQEDREQSANRLEHDWLASVNALYLYGEQHTAEIAVANGKTLISNAAVRERFDNLLRQSETLHERLESAVQEEVRFQKLAKARIAE